MHAVLGLQSTELRPRGLDTFLVDVVFPRWSPTQNWILIHLYAQNPLDTFPRNFPADLTATRQTILTYQDVANKSATSR